MNSYMVRSAINKELASEQQSAETIAELNLISEAKDTAYLMFNTGQIDGNLIADFTRQCYNKLKAK